MRHEADGGDDSARRAADDARRPAVDRTDRNGKVRSGNIRAIRAARSASRKRVTEAFAQVIAAPVCTNSAAILATSTRENVLARVSPQ
jgi:hypothetical protein